jgi:hypothetical protein
MLILLLNGHGFVVMKMIFEGRRLARLMRLRRCAARLKWMRRPMGHGVPEESPYKNIGWPLLNLASCSCPRVDNLSSKPTAYTVCTLQAISGQLDDHWLTISQSHVLVVCHVRPTPPQNLRNGSFSCLVPSRLKGHWIIITQSLAPQRAH